ncbi:DUF4390 domain-containing protein [Caldimonas thermodepolymerans]|uniref:Uncharacterized protein DUF4390 n=1 Tax=Caldimonas thermodepolymerans TaxID=215580 RepID=A0AA46DCW1_9BURK|nr:DUF4390 domain-containing protein [Caldimonas thermodepolymerans]QPC31989.1 DUF4390 domain-containing protein [Caldimonas thermodepolymerans]RDI01485.1 uncharacterized protein DUF4390 [Caldimonas thermodepolymerans]TCP05067.1 uncharacterized protein DUF4390 [Caldimonas thermodepolymerans]UZG44781.1 DUF4390 domain-containing protein [Caldimonas thermodepolymerans]UZG48435.1 DUF4390 domain-containing protein [Caldimonas thermodepolymerans]
MLLLLGWWCALCARAAGIDLREVELGRTDDGLVLSFTAEFELPRSVEDALLKGVPLHFEAEARVLRSRWYWRDQVIAEATRTWRLAYQPLTRRYRVSFGSLNHHYDTLGEALFAIQRTARWRIADLASFEPGQRHYIELSFRLDTSQLPRPFQIGIGGQAEWDLSAESTVVMDDPT